MRLHRFTSYALIAVVGLSGCGSSDGASSPPPPPNDAHPACVISADCPAGTYCDLGECTQSCNTVDPCTGELSCSPRGRCGPTGAPDADPKPPAQHVGDVQATPTRFALTESDKSFSVKLTANSTSPVRYRVQVRGPHLSIDAVRGEFTGSTTLAFKVDASKLGGRDVAGSVKIFTSLGDVIIDAPIHVGLTGSYRATLRYNGGPVALGDTDAAIDLIDANGDVTARVDSKRSMLFPATDAGETTGHGTYTPSDGLDLTLAQRFDASFGADRNPFRRAVGRKLRIQVKTVSSGTLSGTFEETLYGIYSEPIKTTGEVSLSYQPRGADPSFTVTADPQMPDSPLKTTAWSPSAIFNNWTEACGIAVCACPPQVNCSCSDQQLKANDIKYTDKLFAAFTVDPNNPSSLDPFQSLPEACEAGLTATSSDAFNQAPASGCGLIAPLACGVQIGASAPVADKAHGKLVGTLVAHAVAPALLVAKDHVVQGLTDSFSSGAAKEKLRYESASKALSPIAAWMAQPRILEYLRSLDPDVAKGDAPMQGDNHTLTDTYPAGRALVDLFSTMATIDGERARLVAVESTQTPDDTRLQVQTRAVLGYLEAVAMSELLRSWGSVSPAVGSQFLGVLTPLTTGFDALLQGANAFGVPTGFVPFVYRPEDVGKGATNFEQMLAIAKVTVDAEKSLEATFITNKRTYDANKTAIAKELQNISTNYTDRLKDICGSAFNPDAVRTDADWESCGAGKSGEIGVLQSEIDLAQAKIDSSRSRIAGMDAKIQIDVSTLAATQAVHDADIKFTSDQGDEMVALTWGEGAVSAVEDAVRASSDFFGPNVGKLGAGPVIAGLDLLKTGFEVEKVHLQTVQKMHAEQSSKQIEYLNGMANIQKEMIDEAQLNVDIHQDLIGLGESVLKLANAGANARRLWMERKRALQIAQMDPSNDPSYRLLRDKDALALLSLRADAQRSLDLAASALEYELNMSIPGIDGAVMNAVNATSLDQLQSCLLTTYNSSRIANGTPQDYVTTVSVRKMLGILGPRTDSVTGQKLSEGEQFRQVVLRNENIDGHGGVGIVFSTDLDPGNQLWSASVCNDRVASVQAQLVGDFLGDNQAQVNIVLAGGSIMRGCDSDVLRTWSLGSGAASTPNATAVVQAGVNTFGDAPPNTSFFGQSVARASWAVVIPGGADAPSNSDVDITHLDDIVLKFTHKALPVRNSPLAVDFSCLGNVGGH